jgi:hypothetical protein
MDHWENFAVMMGSVLTGLEFPGSAEAVAGADTAGRSG